ncbi:MAG: hypothetical protein LBF62_12905 [Tannerellaceae bacterium]|nr:hypothetical protein [Tannerellaceae bacterium]
MKTFKAGSYSRLSFYICELDNKQNKLKNMIVILNAVDYKRSGYEYYGVKT